MRRSLAPSLVIAALGCAAEPRLELSPEEVDFGGLDIGARSRIAVQLKNRGTDPLRLEEVGLSRTTPDFSLETPPALPFEIPAGERAALVVLFAAETLGEQRAVLRIRAGGEERQLPIRGVGHQLRAEITLDSGPDCGAAGSLDFGRVAVGQTQERRLEISATGTGPISVEGRIEAPGLEWAVEGGSSALAPGERLALIVRYTPQDGQEDRTTLVLGTSAVEARRVEIPLCGRSIYSALCPDPGGLRFGHVASMTSSRASVRLESCGNEAVELRGLAVEGAAGFRAQSSRPLPLSLLPGGSVEVLVDYQAADERQAEAVLRVESDGHKDPVLRLPLRANVPPACAVRALPPVVRFFGGESEQRLVIVNEGTSPCALRPLRANGPGFALAGWEAFELAPGEVIARVVTHRPGSGRETGILELELTAQGAVEVMRVPLEAQAGSPPGCVLQPSPATVLFGAIPLGQMVEEWSHLGNAGDGPCALERWGLDPTSDLSMAYLGGPPPATLGPGEEVPISFTYYPLFEGRTRGRFDVRLQGETAPLSIELFALALPAVMAPCLGEVCSCPDGSSPGLARYDQPTVPSRIVPAGEDTPFHELCVPWSCPMGKVPVEKDLGSYVCSDPPPTCGAGQGLELVNDRLRCVPCDLVVQFGSIFDGLRVCAPQPRLSCPTGQVPTFSESSRRWECIDTCNNGLYDQRLLDGQLVCIPC